MNPVRSFVSWGIRVGTSAVCRIEKDELNKVPLNGPLILAINHVNSLEVPLLFTHLHPRGVTGLAKIETWDSRFMGWLFNLWQAIPIRRGEADIRALKQCLLALSSGVILGVAPEGTRSYDGKLICGKAGIVLVALHSGVPILPVAHWGGEEFLRNVRRLKRTDFHIRVGKPFFLNAGDVKVNSKIRQAMVDEIMCQIAILLPEEYRGQYINCAPPPQNYLRFS